MPPLESESCAPRPGGGPIKASTIGKPLAFLRYAAAIAVISSFFSSLLLFIVGGVKTFKGIYNYFNFFVSSPASGHLTPEDKAVATIIESLDAFLIALVLIYFGYAIYSLAISKNQVLEQYCPDWLTAHSVGELKETLCQLIIVILFVLFARMVWLSLPDLSWDILILPVSIALLSLSLKFY